jgi:hypothetical protein
MHKSWLYQFNKLVFTYNIKISLRGNYRDTLKKYSLEALIIAVSESAFMTKNS